MNYEFHVGDYVETVDGLVGYIESRHSVLYGDIGLYVRFTDGDCHCFEVTDKNIANNFLRIGAYDFTKKEKKKIEPLEKDLPVECELDGKKATIKQYLDDGVKMGTIVYNGKMIDKINELVDTVNKLMDKDDKE